MLYNYNNKLKERDPIDTVKIILNFFTNLGLKVRESGVIQSECGTWSCHLSLLLNHYIIYTSNGKGMTKEFALASGYAELYERFCNYTNELEHPRSFNDIIETNKKNKGYYLDPEEKVEFDFSDNNIENTILYKKLEAFYGSNREFLSRLIKIKFNPYIAVPYTEIGTKEKMFFDPRLVHILSRTQGMVAGNTVEEALVQGISELCEKYVTDSIYFNFDKDQKYFYINHEKIKEMNPVIGKTIEEIEKNDYKVYVYDLSYNYNLPVVMSVFMDLRNKTIRSNLGAHPIFDIALERTLTEIYQNHDNLREQNLLQIPYKTISKEEIDKYGNNYGTMPMIPEDLLFIGKEIDSFNKDVFAKKSELEDNIDLVKKYIELVNRKNWNFYYRNCSLSKDMIALQIFSPQVLDINSFKDNYRYSNLILKNTWLDYLEQTHYLIKNFSDLSYEEVTSIWNSITRISNENLNGKFIGNLMCCEWFSPISVISSNGNIRVFWDINNFILNNGYFDGLNGTLYEYNVKSLITLKNYKDSRYYSEEELKNIKEILSIDIKDIDKIFKDNNEKFNFSYYIPTINFLKSNLYKIYINSFTRQED